MEQVIRNYRFGDMIFRYTGPAFRGTALEERFRIKEEVTEEATAVIVATTVSEQELSEKNAETLVRFERGDVPFYVTEDIGNIRRIYVADTLFTYFSWNIILGHFRLPYYALRRGGAFLHSSMISVDGKAVLFTAEKQVGKSTQARLWKEYRGAETVNGDRAMLYPEYASEPLSGMAADKGEHCWMAASTPYCGTSKISENKVLPLKAVVILSRAGWEGTQADAPSVRKATPMECVKALFDGCTFKSADREDVEAMFALSEDIVKSVQFLKLYGTLGEDSVAALESALTE